MGHMPSTKRSAGSSQNGGEPVLSPAQFQRIARKVKVATGIVLKEHKSVMVQSRIVRRLRDLHISDFDTYMDFLEGPAGAEELTHFCNAITTNLTSFFRENHHFEHLKADLRRSRLNANSKLRLWSAGCSTGEEPYSIAMALMSEVKNTNDKKILATDIDTNVLLTAKNGVYAKDRFDSITSDYRGFTNSSKDDNSFSINSDIKSIVTFNKLNLLSLWPFKGPFDYIFCRNVLIYFDSHTKSDLIDKYAAILRPGGVLYLGHSETILEEHPLLKPEGRTTYRRLP